MAAVTCAVLGAGGRGFQAYGNFALRHPHLVRCLAVADPDAAKRDRFGDAHNIPAKLRFHTWEDLIAARPPVDAIFNCMQDALHAKSAVAVMEAGYHQLLEKPIATTPHDCVRIVRAAKASGKTLAVCHVMRYAPFFQALKQLLTAGDLGEVMTVEHTENVGHWHQAHSFVRGPWSVRAKSSPMILSKSCHDLDILVYLVGRKPLRLSSFGSLGYFKPENAPAGPTERCTDGCPVEPTCPYSAYRTYLSKGLPGWITDSDHLGADHSPEAKMKALRTGPFGRCVWKCGNDVVDHQVANIEFEGGATVSFLMHAFSAECARTMRYGCTKGEIKGRGETDELRVVRFTDGTEQIIHPAHLPGGHGGADTAMMVQFAEALASGDSSRVLSNIDVSLESHLLGFAAEESRLNHGQVIEMADYRARIEREVTAGK